MPSSHTCISFLCFMHVMNAAMRRIRNTPPSISSKLTLVEEWEECSTAVRSMLERWPNGVKCDFELLLLILNTFFSGSKRQEVPPWWSSTIHTWSWGFLLGHLDLGLMWNFPLLMDSRILFALWLNNLTQINKLDKFLSSLSFLFYLAPISDSRNSAPPCPDTTLWLSCRRGTNNWQYTKTTYWRAGSELVFWLWVVWFDQLCRIRNYES